MATWFQRVWQRLYPCSSYTAAGISLCIILAYNLHHNNVMSSDGAVIFTDKVSDVSRLTLYFMYQNVGKLMSLAIFFGHTLKLA
jgi:hypothetical protein